MIEEDLLEDVEEKDSGSSMRGFIYLISIFIYYCIQKHILNKEYNEQMV
jgi:hypothetical protein